MARPITGTIYYPSGAAWASGTVRARLMEPFETSTRVYPKTEITITLDSNGQIPALTQLDTPDTGTAHYLITTPDQANYHVYIATGPSVDLVTLLTIAGTAVAQDDLQTLLDAAAAMTPTSVTAEYTILPSDKYIECSGTFSVHPFLASGTYAPFAVGNIGTGTITISSTVGDTLNGAASFTLYPGCLCLLIDRAAGLWRAWGG